MPDRHSGWVMVGAALRRAQAKGLHKLKTATPVNLENELWKRAFWYDLHYLSQLLSQIIGLTGALWFPNDLWG